MSQFSTSAHRLRGLTLSYLHSYYIYIERERDVIDWPSTEPSIKKCTCVNKRKNSGSRWMLNNYITRRTDGSRQLEIGCQRENQLADWGLVVLSDPRLSNPQSRWERNDARVRRTWGQYSCLSPSPSHPSHITNITHSRIKCQRLYFYKEVCSFVYWSSSLLLTMFPRIFIFVYVCGYTTESERERVYVCVSGFLREETILIRAAVFWKSLVINLKRWGQGYLEFNQDKDV